MAKRLKDGGQQMHFPVSAGPAVSGACFEEHIIPRREKVHDPQSAEPSSAGVFLSAEKKRNQSSKSRQYRPDNQATEDGASEPLQIFLFLLSWAK